MFSAFPTPPSQSRTLSCCACNMEPICCFRLIQLIELVHCRAAELSKELLTSLAQTLTTDCLRKIVVAAEEPLPLNVTATRTLHDPS